jgi:hypothetical protein
LKEGEEAKGKSPLPGLLPFYFIENPIFETVPKVCQPLSCAKENTWAVCEA